MMLRMVHGDERCTHDGATSKQINEYDVENGAFLITYL